MAIYKIQNKKLDPISQKKFDLERDIQKLTESNLLTIFGLIFVSGSLNNEFVVRAQEQDFYIDTLAFDDEQKSFVLVEYKKDRSFSVIDQGFAYLSAMVNHKADFVLELNEKLGKNFKKNDINWEGSKIIFISPEFTNYQRNAINFKNIPIFLYEVILYTNDIIEYNPIKSYQTAESIESLSKDKTIQRVSKEVKNYTFQDHLQKVDEETKDLLLKMYDELLKIGPGIKENVTKYYVAFRFCGTNYTFFKYVNKQIYFYFRSNKALKTSLKVKKRPLSAWDTTPLWEVIIKDETQVPEVINIAKQVYKEYADRYR